jgi:hypothetical protein
MEAVASDVPATATSRYVALAVGWIVREPVAGTIPMPLSSSTDSAPSTSHDRTAGVPAGTSAGTAMNRWIASAFGLPPRGPTKPQA